MKEENIQPTENIYKTIFRSLGKSKKTNILNAQFEELKMNNIRLVPSVFIHMMEGYGNSLKDIDNLWIEMKKTCFSSV
jgi:hypothetical protein